MMWHVTETDPLVRKCRSGQQLHTRFDGATLLASLSCDSLSMLILNSCQTISPRRPVGFCGIGQVPYRRWI